MLVSIMARPANADPVATRARILESAVTLFAEHGLGSTSVRDVAGAAEVSLAMVGHYFGSKDELYEACIAAIYAELSTMSEQLAREIATQVPPHELIARSVAIAFHFARKHRTAVRLLVRAAVSTGELHPSGRKLLLNALDVVSSTLAMRLDRPASE